MSDRGMGKGRFKASAKATGALVGAIMDTAFGLVSLGYYTAVTTPGAIVGALKTIVSAAEGWEELNAAVEKSIDKNIKTLEAAHAKWKRGRSTAIRLTGGAGLELPGRLERDYKARLAWLERQKKKNQERRPLLAARVQEAREELAAESAMTVAPPYTAPPPPGESSRTHPRSYRVRPL